MTRFIRIEWLAVCVGLTSVVSAGAGQAPAPPKFTAGTNVVRVDFVVTDKSGRLVPGVTMQDCIVKEDGKERPIVSFEASIAGAAERSGLLALVAPASKLTIAGELPGTAAQLAAGIDGISGTRLDNHSSFPVLDAEAMAINRGDLQVLARLIARFVLLNPTMTADQADMIAHSRSTDVEFEARKRRETLLDAALQALDWLSDKPGRHSVILVSGGFARDVLAVPHVKPGFHKIQVQLRTKGLNVRARRGYYDPPPTR